MVDGVLGKLLSKHLPKNTALPQNKNQNIFTNGFKT